jgi:hypothetical protein
MGPVLAVILTAAWIISPVACWLMLARTRRVAVAVATGLLVAATAVMAGVLHSRAQVELNWPTLR